MGEILIIWLAGWRIRIWLNLHSIRQKYSSHCIGHIINSRRILNMSIIFLQDILEHDGDGASSNHLKYFGTIVSSIGQFWRSLYISWTCIVTVLFDHQTLVNRFYKQWSRQGNSAMLTVKTFIAWKPANAGWVHQVDSLNFCLFDIHCCCLSSLGLTTILLVLYKLVIGLVN